jgi:hypothetical protein
MVTNVRCESSRTRIGKLKRPASHRQPVNVGQHAHGKRGHGTHRIIVPPSGVCRIVLIGYQVWRVVSCLIALQRLALLIHADYQPAVGRDSRVSVAKLWWIRGVVRRRLAALRGMEREPGGLRAQLPCRVSRDVGGEGRMKGERMLARVRVPCSTLAWTCGREQRDHSKVMRHKVNSRTVQAKAAGSLDNRR